VPARYTAVRGTGLIVLHLDGLVTREEALAVHKALVSEPFLRPGTELLVDANDIVTDMSARNLIEISRMMPALAKRGLRRIAIVTNDTLNYGLARFFSGFAKLPDCHVNAFHSEAEALAWMCQQHEHRSGRG
jgi:hypothetical protein